MTYKTVTRDVGCKECGASGKRPRYEDLGDGDSGSTIIGYLECERCKGRKNHRVLFILNDEPCNATMQTYEAMLKCKNGTLTNIEPFYRHGQNFIGQETRQLIKSHTERCPFCFGTGTKHYVAKKQNCRKCYGEGEITESRWESGFFGGEVKRERRFRCTECQGEKFSWVIDHDFNSTQMYSSNL